MHSIDLQIAIADAFDSEQLRRRASTTEIAQATGVGANRIPLIIRRLSVTLIKKRSAVRDWVPARYAPPRKFPRLNGRSSSVSKAVVDLYESGRWSGRCFARDLADLIDDATEESVVRALKRLKFRVVKRGHRKFVAWAPAVWERPRDWPDVFLKQRELRRSGLSAARVIAAADSAAAVAEIIREAVQKLDVLDIPLDRRGALKAKIKEVIAEVYKEWSQESISKRELAGWLKESPNAPKSMLMARGEQLMRLALRKICPNCGAKVQ